MFQKFEVRNSRAVNGAILAPLVGIEEIETAFDRFKIWKVPSQSGSGASYTVSRRDVVLSDGAWVCNCKDYLFHTDPNLTESPVSGFECKHILAVKRASSL